MCDAGTVSGSARRGCHRAEGFDGGRGAINFVGRDGDDVAGVAGDEQVARARAKDEVRTDAGVGAGEPLGELSGLGEGDGLAFAVLPFVRA